MAKEQLSGANDVLEQLDHDLKIALLPKDPNDEKDIFLEVRPAAGGDEAGLFAAELLKCYMLYASRQ
jgi:peptide chain release factor 1